MKCPCVTQHSTEGLHLFRKLNTEAEKLATVDEPRWLPSAGWSVRMLTRAISRSSYVCTAGTHSLTRCSASDWIRGRGCRAHADTLSAVARCSTVLCSTIPTTLNWNHRIGRRTDDGCGWRCAVFWHVCVGVCVRGESFYVLERTPPLHRHEMRSGGTLAAIVAHPYTSMRVVVVVVG